MDAYIKGNDDLHSYLIDINQLHASSSKTAFTNVVQDKLRSDQNEKIEYPAEIDLYCYEVMSD